MEGLIVYYGIGIVTVLISALFVYLVTVRCNLKPHRSIFITLILASGYIFFAQYLKYQSLHFYVDFSHWLQLLQSITTKGWPEVLNQEFVFPGTLNYFSAHFVPLIYFFAIPFKLFPYPITLIILNVALMFSSAIPLYKLSVLKDGSRRFGLFMIVLLFWYPTFQYITLYEFEMLRFSIPVLLWMLYFWEARKTTLFFLLALTAVLVREEVGLTVAMFGLYAWIFQKRWREGFATIILGLGGFVLITSVVMPAFRSGEYTHIASGSFAAFGRTPLEVLMGVAIHPLLATQIMLAPDKIANIFMLGLPLLFFPLVAFSALFGMVANIGIGLLSEGVVHISYMLYYIAPSVPFIFYAFLKAWPKITARFNAVATIHAALASVLVSSVFFGPSPISLQFWFKDIRPAPFRTQDFYWSVYRVTDHHRKAEEFVRMIPDDAVVSSEQFLAPRLYKKRGTMVFPQLISKDGAYKTEYILIDRTNNGLKPESPAFIDEQEFSIIERDGVWKLLASDDGYELYKKNL